ncbi:MAG: DUF3108 domain-containing protein [Gemmatimonadota bacterium]
MTHIGRPGPALLRAAALALGATLILPLATPAASGADGQVPPGSPWRFPVGERSEYEVYVGLGSVRAPRPLGEASLSVEAIEEVRGTPAYRVAMEIAGGIPFAYKMDDRQVSWVAPNPIRSLRFAETLREGDYRRDRIYRLDQERQVYSRHDRTDDGEYAVEPSESEVSMPAAALDEVSFLYFTRTLPLEVGETYRFHRFFEADGNPVELEVLRRESVRVPAGSFETVVVRPVIQASGIFAEEGRAEVYISDDERGLIVQIKSRMRLGEINMYLTDYDPGCSEGLIGSERAAEDCR